MKGRVESWVDARREGELAAEGRRHFWLFLVQFGALLSFGALFWGSGFSRHLAEVMGGWAPDTPLAWITLRAVYVWVVVVAYEFLLFPLEAVGRGVVGEGFGWWLAGYFGRVLVEAVLLAGGFTVIYAVVRVLPETWWLVATGGYAVVAVGLGEWAPAIWLPKLHPPRVLRDPILLEAVGRAGDAFGREVGGIYEWADVPEEGELPAARLIGGGRRVDVVFPAGLAGRLSRESLTFLAARKMAWAAHIVNVRMQIVRTLFAGAVFFLAGRTVHTITIRAGLGGGAGELGAFPLLAMAFFTFAGLAGLCVNALARLLELRADALAIENAEDDGILERQFRELYAVRPFLVSASFWQTLLLAVPTPAQRLAVARMNQRRGGVGGRG